MKTIQKTLVLLFISITIASCNTQQPGQKVDNTIDLWVNSQMVVCVGVGPMKCMQVQESDSIHEGQWQNFYSNIEGFEFEKGFVYHLKVKKENLDPKNIPADASSIKYTLVEQVSKEKAPLSLDGKWKLISISMKALAITDESKIPEIKINMNKKQLNGFSGCNRVTMGVDVSTDAKIHFQEGIMTRMACPEPNYEHDFMQAMNSVDSYKISKTNLVFFNEDGLEVLNFQRLN